MHPIRSIGIIMDGNRRFARAQEREPKAGHEAGYRMLKKLAREFPRLKKEYGLEYVTLYAFSTENWKRDPQEVRDLLGLFEQGIQELGEEFAAVNVRVRAIGDLARFPELLQKMLTEIEARTESCDGGTAVFALSYGGRAEIVSAVNKAVEEGRPVTEESFSEKLWTTGIPDPALIIRTSGEQRLSNFLPWQSVYSELFFTETLWPDFTVEELEDVFARFRACERRHGK